MTSPRIEIFRKMLTDDPGNNTVRFGLATELIKAGNFEDAVNELTEYLNRADDQGNGYGKLAHCYEELGRTDDARKAYKDGIIAAKNHGHPGMAQEFESALEII